MKRWFLLPLILLAACQSKPVIDVQAHRGGAGLMPENTIPAMQNALDLGVNTLDRWWSRTTATSIRATPRVRTDR